MEGKDKKYDFEDYKKEIFDFQNSNQPYSYLIGDPDELSSAIGLISMGFQRLENVLSAFIIEMLDIDIPKGKIIVSELSFTSKVNIFSSLFHLLKDTRHFNFAIDRDKYFKELVKALLRCQDFRNQVMHSTFIENYLNGKIIRQKISAKAKKGLSETIEEIDISHLIDIYDYTVSISMEVEEFFINFNPKRITGENMYHSTEIDDFLKFEKK